MDSHLFQAELLKVHVFQELSDLGAPTAVREWIARPPIWLEVKPVEMSSDPALEKLHLGEREAIRLAEEIEAEIVLLDERRGWREAERRNFRTTGILGVLEEAAERDLIDLPKAVERLRETNFHEPKKVVEAMLARDLERKQHEREQSRLEALPEGEPSQEPKKSRNKEIER